MTKTSKIKGALAGLLMAGSAIGIALTPTEAGAQTPSGGAVTGKVTATTKPAKITTTTKPKPPKPGTGPSSTSTTVKPPKPPTTTTTVKPPKPPTTTTTTTTVKPIITTTTIPGTKSPGVLFFEQWTKKPQGSIDFSKCVMVQEASIRAGHQSKPPYELDPKVEYWEWVMMDGSATSNSQFWHIGWFSCRIKTPPTYPPTTT